MEVIDKFVSEFLISRQHNPRISPTSLLSGLELGDSPDFLNLKVSSVLRDISNSLIRGTVDEGTLDLLEILEMLLMLQQRSQIMEPHKSAYCWTAAECTLRFMWPLSASDGFFTDALERIWTKRIGILKESCSALVTSDLLKWETDLKNALEDPELYQRIRETNIRYTAVSFLTQLLKEQWALLGSSSFETVVQKKIPKRKAENVEGDIVDKRVDPNAVDESTRLLESNTIDNADEAMGAQEQAHEPSFDKGDKTAARELKDFLLEIQEHIDRSTRQGQEPNNAIDHLVDVTPQPALVSRIGTSGEDHNESPQQDNMNGKGSNSRRTRSGRVQPHLLSPTPLNLSPLKKSNSPARRPNKFWTPEEVAALRKGVKEYGKSWKDIKNANPAVFKERTEVDLKDKWRNLVR